MRILSLVSIHRTSATGTLPTKSTTFRRQPTLDAPVFNLFQPNSRAQSNRRPAASPEGAANQMIRVSRSQSKRRACGGARPSGSTTRSAEGALPFRCDRILSITAGSSMQPMILTCPAHRSQVSMSILNTRFSLCIARPGFSFRLSLVRKQVPGFSSPGVTSRSMCQSGSPAPAKPH